MSHRRFLGIALIAVLVLAALAAAGLLIVGGPIAYHAAWPQGYGIGQQVPGGEEGPTAPRVPYGYWYPGRYFGFIPLLCGLGFFFKVGLILLLVVAIIKFCRFRAWGKAVGPNGQRWPWHRHPPFGAMHPPFWGQGKPSGEDIQQWAEQWRRWHDHVSPWRQGSEKPGQEEMERAEQDAETGAAEAED